MNIRASWSNLHGRHRRTAARVAIVVGSVLAIAYSWPLGAILIRLYFPEPGRSCGTPEVFALLAGALIVAPVALLLAAAQPAARRTLHDRLGWRTASWGPLVALPLAVIANWLGLIQLVWR